MVDQRVIGVDPRACGVDLIIHDPSVESAGGSPRMRGRRFFYDPGFVAIRWIPAHAG